MSRVTLIDNEYVSLYYHTEEKIIHHEFHKYVQGDSFREMLTLGGKTLKEHGARKWLSDDRNYVIQNSDDIHWAQTVWQPLIQANGWKYWAVVMPVKTAAQLNVTDFVARYRERGIVAEVFDTVDAGFQWLKGQ